MNAEPLGDDLQRGESSRFNCRVETLPRAPAWRALKGSSGHITEQRPAVSQMDTKGNLTITDVQCNSAVTAAPRGTVNIFNISVTSDTCYNGPGIVLYDNASRKLYALAAFYNGLLGFPDIWYAIGTRQ